MLKWLWVIGNGLSYKTMLDIKFILQNQDFLKKIIKDKKIDLNIDDLINITKQKNDLTKKLEGLQQLRNLNSSKMKNYAKLNELEKSKLTDEGKNIKNKISDIEGKLNPLIEKYKQLMLIVPNLYSADTPIGESDEDNKEIFKWGKLPKFKFKPKDHIGLGKDLDLIDFDQGVKVSGFRGYFLKNEAVLLQLGLIMHAIKKMQKNGFQLTIPPTLIKDFALIGSGHFPFGKEEIYKIGNPHQLEDKTKDEIFLSGTSESSLLAYYSDKTLTEIDLPIKLCGFSQCYRSEVGSYGKDTKGIYRIHEFMKVEQVVICKNDLKEGTSWLEKMRKISEEMLQDLKLPYRILSICTADMGAGKYKMYDLESYMPSRNGYGETHSDSFLTDWQARRLNIKYKNKTGETKYVYTLNNTVIASPRILIAILENYQKADGSVDVPKVLQPYVGKKVIKPLK